MQILNFGSCNIDSVYAVDHILRPGETISATSVASFPGGKGLNQSIALARAGAAVYHAGCIGKDGGMLLDCMHESGVDTRYLRTVDDKTGLAIIQVDKNAENAIVIYSGANGRITKEHIDTVLENFHEGDLMLAQNEISELPYLIEQAAQKGIQVVFNPSPFNERIYAVNLDHITYMILNEVEAAGFWGSADPDILQPMLAQKYPRMKILLTLGKQGSVYFDGGIMLRQSAFMVKSVDTTAAGDTYTGYFIAGIANGDDIQTAMCNASAASALTVSQKGASSSIPYRQTVDAMLSRMQTYGPHNAENTRSTILSYLNENYTVATLSGLAGKLGYSKAYTSCWIRQNLKTTFTELLQAKRCSVAADLLKNSHLPVCDIIQKAGYRNETFFRKAFTQLYGCTPLKYRQKEQK